ncbi:hypothetical protein B1812_08505 [Methylocystis bryophila]|uniref:Sulfotransferase family protein n=2 Tax=Methylocystis bryophila TaxID=655015 RepID=A0A1W6MU78_9HYPH|nr:hypothetical protein B1812_08505 [Methylocystis bryophila]
MQGHPSNERGHFESDALMHLNDAILASAGSSWDDWRAFNPDWLQSAEAEDFEEKAVATLKEEFGAARLIVVKDPRICRMTAFWTRVLERADYAVHVIVPVRSPLEVASSLRLRDGFPTSKGLLLWLRHVLDAEAATRQSPRHILHWPDFLADWRLSMARAGERTELVWPRLSDRTAADIDRFLAPSLRHNVVDAETLAVHPDVNDWIKDVYSAMVALSDDPASIGARQRLDDARAAFEKASRIFGRVLVDFEENVVAAQAAAGSHAAQFAEASRAREGLLHTVAGLTGERDHLAAQLGETSAARDGLQHAVAALTGERDLLAAQLGETSAACDGLQHAVAALTGERDHLAAQLGEISASRDGLQHAVVALTGERDHLAVRLGEISAARDSLQHAVVALTEERDSLLAQSTAVCAERERAAHEAAEERKRFEGLLLERLTSYKSS